MERGTERYPSADPEARAGSTDGNVCLRISGFTVYTDLLRSEVKSGERATGVDGCTVEVNHRWSVGFALLRVRQTLRGGDWWFRRRRTQGT